MGISIDETKTNLELTPSPNKNKKDYTGVTNDKIRDSQIRDSQIRESGDS